MAVPASSECASLAAPRFLQRLLSDDEQRIRTARLARNSRSSESTTSTMSSGFDVKPVGSLCRDGNSCGLLANAAAAECQLQNASTSVLLSSGNTLSYSYPTSQAVPSMFGTKSGSSSTGINRTARVVTSHLPHAGNLSTASSEDWRYGSYGYSSGESLTSASASPNSAFYPSPGGPFSLSPPSANSHCGPNPLLHQPFSLPPPSLDIPSSTSSTPLTLSPRIASGMQTEPPIATTSHISVSTRANSSDEDEANLEAAQPDDGLLELPENFAMVYPNVYRSSFPNKKHFQFLQGLGLTTVLTLVQEEYPEQNRAFFKQNGIRFLQIGMPGNKVSISESVGERNAILILPILT